MTSTNPKTNIRSNQSKQPDYIKPTAWLIEAVVRVFAGYALLTNVHNLIADAAALYLLSTAAVIVVMHFIKAHKA